MSVSSVFPLEIQELRRPENTYRLDVKYFTSIKDIKDQLQREYNYPISRMRLYYDTSSKPLKNQTTLHDLDIKKAGHVLRLAVVFTTSPQQFMLEPTKGMCLDEDVEEMVRQIRLGINKGHQPAKTDMLDCTGGVYFMKGLSNTPTAVFKPSDEEQGMPNNPKGFAGNGDCGLRLSFKPGEGHVRECAAYILDYQNFCHVPPTTMVHMEHDAFNYPRDQKGQLNMFPKLGSLQRFVPAGDTFEDIGHSMVSVLELQKIALLDMRLLNCDRNASNMLAIRKPAVSREQKNGPRKYSRSSSLGTASETAGSMDEMDLDEFLDGPLTCSNYSTTNNSSHVSSKYSDSYALIPIDHGYCLPSALHIDEYDWAWFSCPHVDVEVMPEIREYMNNLDIELLLADLTSQLPVSTDCLFLLRVAHTLIKEGINAGLTLKEIACMIARTDEDVPSALETAITNAEDNAQRAIESRASRRQTSSPAFLKSMESAQAVFLAQNAVSTASAGIADSMHDGVQEVDEVTALGVAGRESPESPTPSAPPLVRQRSVGSPRSAGGASPPQRISHKRIASTPEVLREGISHLCAPVGNVHGYMGIIRTRSSSEEDEFPHSIATTITNLPGPSTNTRVAAAAVAHTGTAPAATQGTASAHRPFPLRSTPDRIPRGISSELNLEALGTDQLMLQQGFASPGYASSRFGSPGLHSPNPNFIDGRATSHSLSSMSRSPLPLPLPLPLALPETSSRSHRNSGSYAATGTTTATGNIALGNAYPNLSTNIAYLSSENISKHTQSAKYSEFPFRDPNNTRPTSRRTSNVSGDYPPTAQTPTGTLEGGGGSNEQYGDYFMKDLSLPPLQPPEDPSSALHLHLVSSNNSHSSCSSPHSAFVMLHPGSRERISSPRSGASSSDKLSKAPPSANTTTIVNTTPVPVANPLPRNPHSGASLTSSTGSSSAGKNPYTNGLGGGLAGISAPIVRPRAGEPLIATQSFDADYVRVHNSYDSHSRADSGSAAPSTTHSAAVSPLPGSMMGSSSNNNSRSNIAFVDSLFSYPVSRSAPVVSAANTALQQRVQVPVHTVRDTSNGSHTSSLSNTTTMSSNQNNNTTTNNNNHHDNEAAYPSEGASRSLTSSVFASDSDLTASQSVATSYESAFSSSPKLSPTSTMQHHTDDCFGRNAAQSREKAVRVLENLRDSESSNEGYLSDRSPRTINSNSIDHCELEAAETDAEEVQKHAHERDESVLFSMPLKDLHDRSKLNLRTMEEDEFGLAGESYEFVNAHLVHNEPSPQANNISSKLSIHTADCAATISNDNVPVRVAMKTPPLQTTSTTAAGVPIISPLTASTMGATSASATADTDAAAASAAALVPTAFNILALRPSGLSRVASFTAFDSPPLYSLPKYDRKGNRLKLEKRNAMARTQEFQDLRLSFCKETIGRELTRMARNKSHKL